MFKVYNLHIYSLLFYFETHFKLLPCVNAHGLPFTSFLIANQSKKLRTQQKILYKSVAGLNLLVRSRCCL